MVHYRALASLVIIIIIIIIIITYLIPKSGDSKEVRNYRPNTCLTTMYKTLTEIIAKRISTHLEQQSLLPAEQKGCHPGSKVAKIN
jgi:hypothetical protein